MRKLHWLVVAAFAVAFAAPAFAGSAGEKCSQDAQTCLNHMAAKKDMGWVGLEYDKDASGVTTVKKITPESPAAAAGFQAGDILVAINGVKLENKEALKKAKGDWKAGQTVAYTVSRKGAEQKLSATLAKMPEMVYASMVGGHMISDHMQVATAQPVPAAEKVEAKTAAADKK